MCSRLVLHHVCTFSHILHHTSYIIHRTSYIVHHASHIIHHTSYITHHIHTSHIIHHTSYSHIMTSFTHHTSHIIHHTSYITHHTYIYATLQASLFQLLALVLHFVIFSGSTNLYTRQTRLTERQREMMPKLSNVSSGMTIAFIHRTHVHHTSYFIHDTSYIMHHTSYITHHTSYIIHHTSYIIPSYIIHHTSYIIHHTSYIHTSYIHTSYHHTVEIEESMDLKTQILQREQRMRTKQRKQARSPTSSSTRTRVNAAANGLTSKFVLLESLHPTVLRVMCDV